MVHICNLCNNNYESLRGLHIHQASCKKRFVKINNSLTIPLTETLDNNNDVQIETAEILAAGEINIEKVNSIKSNLFEHDQPIPPNFLYHDMTGETFVNLINDLYEEIVTWKKNMFKLPTGNAAKSFIKELTIWLERFNCKTAHHSIAIKVYMILPVLMLQKPSKTSKAKEHCKKLEHRLAAWKDGRIDEIIQECRTIQNKFSTNERPKKQDDKAKIFAKLVFQGKINAAMKFLTENDVGVHQVDDKILQALQEKHPQPSSLTPDVLLNGPINRVLPSYFDELDETMIFKSASMTKGSGGPMRIDAEQYRRILTSNKYKKENKELRVQLAIFAQNIATQHLDPNSLEAFVSCRLIPLDKNPGVRPIGIGETTRRIVGKCISWILRKDIQQAAGPLQTATGLQGGAEAAIHSMKLIFENEGTDGVILVDASNAFNSLNRNAALHNIRILCPQFSTILINTYRLPVRMFIQGGGEILSVEGTTQGDNLAMSFYALGISILLDRLKISSPNTRQVGLADDITGAGKIHDLRLWWDTIIMEGKKVGYYVNETKSWLIIKDAEKLNHAQDIFNDTGIKFTCEGKRHLGAVIGSNDFKSEYVREKVDTWIEEIERLTEYSKTQPHAAYAIFCRGVLHKYTYFMRTIDGLDEYLKPIDDKINSSFLPTLLDSIITDNERSLFSLPVKLGGLGIPVLSEIASEHFESSTKISAPLVSIMILQGDALPEDHIVKNIKLEETTKRNAKLQEKVTLINQTLSPTQLKAVNDIKDPGASNWLSAMPLEEYNFVLNKKEFRDAICLRYGKELKGLPSKCPCGQNFNLTHALNCKTGGFVIIRHNRIRDFEAELLKKTCNDVEIEPPLQPLEGEIVHGLDGLNAKPDVRARGFWREGQNAFFDIRITNTNSEYQRHLSSEKIFAKHEKEKKRQYNHRIMNIEHGTFTPLVFSVSGGMAKECSRFHKAVAEKISQRLDCKYDKVMSLIKCKLSFLILRASLMCVRGSRSIAKHFGNHEIDDFEIAFDSALG